MVVMGVIGALVILLIYFVVRGQALQKETSQLKRHLKSNDASIKFTHGALLLITKELEKSCLAKLHSANKHGVMNAGDFEFANFMVSNMEFVVLQCCERRSSVEEAIKKSLKARHMDFDSLCQFIAKQPTEIRIPWCKNSLSGYIVACQNISQTKIPTKTTITEVSETETG